MSLAETIHDALGIKAPEESQQRIQEAVARRLDELSPGAAIKRTGYFNHSWVPDLVVKWREGEDRPVYLRLDVKDPSFDEDLGYLAEERPFFLDLVDGVAATSNGNLDFDLGQALAQGGREQVLVSEVTAVDRLESGVDAEAEAKKATRQVVVGGHGLLDGSAADSIMRSWREASDAAESADPAPLRSALDAVEQFLDRVASLDLETDLRAKWVAAGHDADAFPGREDWQLNDRGPREIAELVASLVDGGESVEHDQWNAIAESISLTALGSELANIGRAATGALVNDLVRAALTYWTAQYAYFPALDSDSMTGAYDWSYGRYAFAVNLVRREAFFTDSGRKWGNVKKPDSLPDARGRIEALDRGFVLGAGIVTPDEQISHELRATATATLAEKLGPFIKNEPSWQSARLQWLDLKVPGTDLRAHVDFSRDVMRADASIPLRTMVLLVAEFGAALTDEELEKLRESLPETG
ncbi:MAG: hypothetical protein JST08_17920 [Actinobacteria bacterium]|nr:hypothetical protein [Actinomycetota bacterium]